jgi:nucleoside-diphosphate-sugar epimerase
MILVTGGTGFIGSHLVENLLARGERVRALVRRTGLFDKTSVEVFYGDLETGNGLIPAIQGVDTVIHLAGVTKALSTADYYAGNVQATENLARAIASSARPVRMVHVSSQAAVGPGPDAVPLTEDAEPHPVTHYGKSKLEGERIVRAILPDAVILRPPAVYGPRDTDVFQILKSINRGFLAQVAGDERYFSTIYVADLVDGIIAAAHSSRSAARTYFLAHPAAVPWSELVGIAAKIMGRVPHTLKLSPGAANAVGYCAEMWSKLTRKPGIVSRDKIRDMQCRYWICDVRRAKEELGFVAPTDIREGLASTLAWYREAGWLKW